MNCQDLLKLLNEYVDGTLEPGACEHFERHMSGCNPCRVVVDNIRQTITLYREGDPIEIPFERRERLHRAVRERWVEIHPGKTP